MPRLTKHLRFLRVMRHAVPPLCRNRMCGGSEAHSYLWHMDFVYYLTLGLRVMKKNT